MITQFETVIVDKLIKGLKSEFD